MEDYVSNSHKSREAHQSQEKLPPAEKKVAKVVSGAATPKKKNELQKLADTFISEDVENVKDHLLRGVLIPAAKKTLWDMVTNGLELLLYGETGKTNRRGGGGTKISYRDYYERANPDRRESRSTRPRSAYDYDNILFDTRGDAEAVLEELEELISVYNIASVMDLYSAAGLQCDFTYNKYGWTDISTAKVVPVHDGYMIKLPKAMPLG